MWKLAEAIIGAVFALVIVSALAYAWIKHSGVGDAINPKHGDFANHKWTLTHDDDGIVAPHIIATGMGSAVVFVVAAAAMYDNALIAVQIFIAPKIYLIEYAASLAK